MLYLAQVNWGVPRLPRLYPALLIGCPFLDLDQQLQFEPPARGSKALTALSSLNTAEGGLIRATFSSEGHQGQLPLQGMSRAPLGSWPGRTWARDSALHSNPTPARVHTHHCPETLAALSSSRQARAQWPPHAHFCQWPVDGRQPTGGSRPHCTPRSPLHTKHRKLQLLEMEAKISILISSGTGKAFNMTAQFSSNKVEGPMQGTSLI